MNTNRNNALSFLNELASRDLTEVQNYSKYTEQDKRTWRKLFENQMRQAPFVAHSAFISGLTKLEINGNIPKFEDVNSALRKNSGWGIYVCHGTLEDSVLYAGLATKMFPVTNFFRSAEDWTYTPAPDMFHEIYGHLPMLNHPEYGELLKLFGEIAEEFDYQEEVIKMLPPLFWFLVEFVLTYEHGQLKCAGPGILSSVNELLYCVHSEKPSRHMIGQSEEAMKKSIRQIIPTVYDIENFQHEYFVVQGFSHWKDLILCIPDVIRERV